MISLLLAGLFAQDTAAFTRTPAQLAALPVPANTQSDAIVFQEDTEVVLQADGRQRRRYYLLYKVLTPQGAQDWTSVGSTWAPWYQKTPVLKARVIAPAGTEHWLDPKTIADAPAREKDSNTYSDRRSTRAPLPAIAPGAVVEAEIIEEDRAPFFAGGSVSHQYLSRRVPVEKARLTLIYPAALPLKWKTEKLTKPEPAREEKDGQVTLRFEHGPAAPDEDFEKNMPPEMLTWPSVSYSTGASWNALAREYAQTVDRQLANASVARFTRNLPDATLDKIRTLLARLHEEVRYEAVELGEASLVPRAPAETLARKFGDCKDQSALLVAMLRAAGIPAHVALLSSGYGRNPDVALPGMGIFDHAIVYVPGEKLFIDPTDSYSPVGELPLADQGRLALVADASTQTLMATPESNSKVNRIREVREFTLTDNGKATVTETTTTYGAPAASDRSYYGEGEPKKIREQLEKYVKEVYLSEKLDQYETRNIKDLAAPPELMIRALEATRGSGDRNELAVGILPSALTERLPGWFRDDEIKPAQRKAPLMIFEPLRHEWHYRIAPPRGFQLRTLPAPEKIDVGGTVLERSFRQEEGLIIADLALDIGQRRLTAAQAMELRAKVQAWRKAEPILIYFDQTGEKRLRAGDVKGALEEFRALAAADPKNALHRTRIARAFLAAGLGESARREARAATELDAHSVDAWSTLASVLEHDLIGRFREPGMDWANALKAWQKALELAPDNVTTRANYAIALEHDERGRRYAPGARMADAIEQYRKIPAEDLAKMQVANNVGAALLRSGRAADALTHLESIKAPTLGNHAQKLAALSVTRGADAALEELGRLGLNAESRESVAASAGQLLLAMRRYPEAGRMLGAAAQGGQNAAQRISIATALASARRLEGMPGTDPISVAKRFIFDAGRGTLQAAPGGFSGDFVKDLVRGMRQGGVRDFPIEATLDLALALARFTPEGDERAGMRVRIQFAGAGETGPAAIPLFLSYAKDAWQVVEPIAEISRRIEAGDLEGAKRWLDWAREEETGGGSIDDPLSGRPFARLWRKGLPPDARRMRIAAASMNADEREAEKALVLAKTEDERTALERILATRQVKVAEGLYERYPESDTAFTLLTSNYQRLARWKDQERVIAERLKRLPGDHYAQAVLIDAKRDQGDFDGAAKLGQELIASGKATAGDLNNLAWLAVMRGRTSAQDLDWARQAAVGSQQAPWILHTMAAVYALAGQTKEAREVLLQTMSRAGLEEPNESIWLVCGIIADQFGAREEARAAYQRVIANDQKKTNPASNQAIARSRMK